ncbi:MAG: aminoacyl-tRNA hydrolase [Azoarcus sp.]|nr:aminoacyl-tRNA hydrolase [Azoarcus sp.]
MTEAFPVPPDEVEISAIRASGPGGQNVNKVSSAVHLRFDIGASSLPDEIKERLLARGDRRIGRDGVLVIKAQKFRSLEKNRAEALRRLEEVIEAARKVPRKRVPTRPTRGSIKRRLAGKTHRARIKAGRRAPGDD